MITITSSGSSIVFEFDDNQHYLQNGTIEVPVNSLMLVTDDSGMFTFKKSSTNDIFLSGLYTEIGMTKDELIAFYKENMVGEQGGGSSSGITSGEVQTMIDESISGKADSSAVTEDIAAAVSGKVDTSAITSYVTSASTDSELPTAKAVYDALGESGKPIEAGRGIDITTGETADTVSLNLSISAGTGTASIREGNNTTASGQYSHAEGNGTQATGNCGHAEGYWCKAFGSYSHAEGYSTSCAANNTHTEGNYTVANNDSEHASGKFNVSNKASNIFGSSGNTLFSVGNGTTNARHNAFEIRQNGDIYIVKDGNDVKLQDQLGGGITSGEVQTMIDESTSGITTDVNTISGKVNTNEEVTARALNTLNGELSGKADTSAVTENINAAVSGKVDTSVFETYSGSVETALSGKQDTLSAGSGITIDSANTISVTGGSITIDPTLDSGSTNPVANSAITQNFYNYAKFVGYAGEGYVVSLSSRDSGNAIGIEGTKIKTTASSFIQGSIVSWLYTSTINGKKAVSSSSSNTKDFSLVETSAITTSVTSASTDSQVPSAKAVHDKLGGLSIVKLTESEYAALVTKDSNVLYIVVPNP